MEIGLDKKVARDKLQFLMSLNSRQEIYKACNFEQCIPARPDVPFVPEASVDFMISNCVLPHIPVSILGPEMVALRRMLKPDGAMYFMIGHDDHWAFHDASANMFNYYRYSDRFYQTLFETKFEYQNRMVKSEWLAVFDRARLQVADYYAEINDASLESIRRLPHIDDRFAQYPVEELATIHSYFLLKPADVVAPRRDAAASIMV